MSRSGIPALMIAAAFSIDAPSASAQVTRISVDSGGTEANGDSGTAWFSADGSVVVFVSLASNLVANDTNGTYDVFVRELASGTTERVSVASDGSQGDGSSLLPSISADGRFVAFLSGATNFAADDTNGQDDVFVHDRLTGVTERVNLSSSGEQADGPGYTSPSISGDGRLVTFSSLADNLVADDTNGFWDVFVRDRLLGTTVRVDVGPAGEQANGDSAQFSTISGDGRFAVFTSNASNLVAGDENHQSDAFARDLVAGVTEIVSVNSAGVPGNDDSGGGRVSADGRFVAFMSWAWNFSEDDHNWDLDVFVRDRVAGTTEIVSVDSFGAGVLQMSFLGDISTDGRFVVFFNDDARLVLGDTNRVSDAFLHDRATGVTERLSLDAATIEGNDGTEANGISADGRFVLMTSRATNLVPGDTNGRRDVFMRDRGDPGTSWSVFGSGLAGARGVPRLTSRAEPVLGRVLGVDTSNSANDYTVGALIVGFEKTSLPGFGGELLVAPWITQLIGLSPWGMQITEPIPDDSLLAGLEIDLQILELDPGASKGISFTNGLELVLGR